MTLYYKKLNRGEGCPTWLELSIQLTVSKQIDLEIHSTDLIQLNGRFKWMIQELDCGVKARSDYLSSEVLKLLIKNNNMEDLNLCRNLEPAALGEEVSLLQWSQAIAHQHRWELHAGPHAVPGSAAGELGPAHVRFHHHQRWQNRLAYSL